MAPKTKAKPPGDALESLEEALTKPKGKVRIALLRALKQAELAAEEGLVHLRTADARLRYACTISVLRDLAIAHCRRDTGRLEQLAKTSESLLKRPPAGEIFSPEGARTDETEARFTLVVRPDVAARTPLFERSPAVFTRYESALELRALVRPHLAGSAGTIAALVVGYVRLDVSELGRECQRLLPRGSTALREVQARAEHEIDRVLRAAKRAGKPADAEGVVRTALRSIGYAGRKNASLYEAPAARMKREATNPRRRMH